MDKNNEPFLKQNVIKNIPKIPIHLKNKTIDFPFRLTSIVYDKFYNSLKSGQSERDSFNLMCFTMYQNYSSNPSEILNLNEFNDLDDQEMDFIIDEILESDKSLKEIFINSSSSNKLSNFISSIQKYYDSITEEFRKAHDNLMAFFKNRAEIVKQKLNRCNMDYVTLSNIDETFIQYLVQTDDTYNQEDLINDLLIFFDFDNNQELIDMVKNWEDVPYFKWRKYIILGAINSYQNGFYTNCVLALLPLIEGIIKNLLDEYEDRSKHDDSFQSQIKRVFNIIWKLHKRYNISIDNNDVLNLISLRDLLNSLFISYDIQEEIEEVLNRNFNLHGDNWKELDKKEAVRMFLILNSLNKLAKIYHSQIKGKELIEKGESFYLSELDYNPPTF